MAQCLLCGTDEELYGIPITACDVGGNVFLLDREPA